ncbi:leucine-rich repeat flightless-interacting protein 1-like isoform X2 [Xiphophorus couchianus]|uniref:leucine-rich repeat flightless-interacting protein 1-like isoform X2 n=2 Tax=Xiphophorus couchianus TaxID=32473 RepID=UPI001016F146|nr:leucine-rich repeat flightless-interacting protein 1-like isoform X2 [Xiphophorus couchianus]
MGTQGPGRKRIPNRDKLAAEEDALSQIAREAEARLAAKRAARAEAREIRMKELERQQKELFHSTKVGPVLPVLPVLPVPVPASNPLVWSPQKYYGLDNKWGHIEQWMEDSERYSRLSRRHTSISDDEERMSVGSRGSYRVEEKTDREFTDKGSRTASTLSAATLASLGGASSRRGSCDTSFSVETEASIREMKDSLAEAEEKYRRAMVSNAQLHNDKTALMFQVENLMEELSDVEELLWEARRRWDDATKELERERQAHSVLKVQFSQTEETLRKTNELLTEVSDLRQKSSSYRQEISDLQEALQWKEKKIAALERHREISDIVRIERDQLTDEVVQLRDSLKTHGVVISPDTATNGDADQTEESPSLLAEDSPHSGRESILGKASQQQPADGSKTPQNDPKDNKRSLPQNMISVSDQTRPSREKRNPTEKHPGRNRQTRSKAGKKDPTKKLPVRADGNEANKKQLSKEDPAQKVFRSRLVPPRSAKDIILGNRAMVLGLSAAEKLSSPSEEAITQDASLALQSESSSSETNFEQKHMSTSDLGSQSQDEDRNAEDEVSGFSEEGPSLEAAAESNKSKAEAAGGEEGSIRRTEVSPETKVHFASPPENQSTGEPLQRAAQVHKACPESPKTTSPFPPEEMWTSLVMNVQDLLQGLEDKPGFVVEISRIFSEILMCLHHWISDLENTLRNRVGRESCLNDGGGHESVWPLRGTRLSTWLLTSLTRETAEGPGCEEEHLAGCSASPRVNSARERMEDPSGSSSRVCSTSHDHCTTNDEREMRSRARDVELKAESEASPPDSPLKTVSGDFVFVDLHFSESHKNSTDFRSDSQTHVLTSVKDSKELGGNCSSSAHSSVGQSSFVRRFMEVTAEEIRALAVPELALVGLQEGRRLDRSSVGSTEELSVGDMDSCEEADEEEEVQLLPSQQQNRSTMEDEVQVIAPPLGTMEPETEHEEPGLDSGKNDNTDCKLS